MHGVVAGGSGAGRDGSGRRRWVDRGRAPRRSRLQRGCVNRTHSRPTPTCASSAPPRSSTVRISRRRPRRWHRSDGREGSTRSVDRRWRRSSPRPRRMAPLLPAVSPGAPNCRRRCFRSSCGTSRCWGSTRSIRRDLCVPVHGKDSRMAASSRSSTRLPISSRCRTSGDLCQQILDGQIRGRVVIDVNA